MNLELGSVSVGYSYKVVILCITRDERLYGGDRMQMSPEMCHRLSRACPSVSGINEVRKQSDKVC